MKNPPFWSPLNDWVLRGVERLMPWIEPRIGMPVAHLRTCLKNLRKRGFSPDTLIDIGANRAAWSREFLDIFPRTRVLLVEPQQELAGKLNQFCTDNPNCSWVQAAVAEKVGTATFTVLPDTYSSGFHHEQSAAEANGWERRTVDVTTLDALVDKLGSVPHVVKIDAEGCEMKILKAATKVWGSTQMFFVEANLFDDTGSHGLSDIVCLMNERGYVPYDFSWFYKRPYDNATMLCETVFVPRQSPLRQYKYWS
jgi:FkbM family methyltransferase